LAVKAAHCFGWQCLVDATFDDSAHYQPQSLQAAKETAVPRQNLLEVVEDPVTRCRKVERRKKIFALVFEKHLKILAQSLEAL
jgi:hypothetical protein